MEQNSQNRRSYSNERNTNQDQNRNDQGYRSSRSGDNERDNKDWRSNNDYGNDSGNRYNRQNQRQDNLNDSGWNNWSNQYSPGYDSNSYRNRNENNGRRDYNRSDDSGYSDRNRDFDSFRNHNEGWQTGGSYNNQSDYNRDWDRGNYGSGYSERRSSMYGTRNDRNEDYGRYNRSQDYGRNNYSNDYDRNRQYGNYGNSYDRSQANRNENRYGLDNDRGWWERTKDEVSSWFGDDDAQRRRDMDNRSQFSTSHRGKGPKDYKRSEERIREDVSDKLSDSHDVDASEIDVKVQGNEVILSGQVNSRNEKHRAEDIAESVSGVSNVQNHLRVSQQQWNNSNRQSDVTTVGQQYNSSSYGSGSTMGSTADTSADSSKGITGTDTRSSATSTTDKNKSSDSQIKPEKTNLS